MSHVQLLQGDAQQLPLADQCVHSVITSPPYWHLRDYQVAGQLGLEDTPEAYVAALVAVFREVKRVLRDDGTVWLNLGDSYNEKNLVGLPWRVAFALQADGWMLRSEIIWHKQNTFPESVTDRPTKAHEQVFLFSKKPRYFYDAVAIADPAVVGANGSSFLSASDLATKTGIGRGPRNDDALTRNARTVWTISSEGFSLTGMVDDWNAYDYVGPDGKPYIASRDCPVHGHRFHARTFGIPGYDAQSGLLLPCSPDISAHHVPSQVSLPDSTISHNSLGVDAASVLRQTTGSMDVSRKTVPHHEHTSDVKTGQSTSRTLEADGQTLDSQDSMDQPYAEPARRHSKRSRKNVPALLTSAHDNACAQQEGHKPNMALSPVHTGSAAHTHANSSVVGSLLYVRVTDPSGQMPYHTVCIESVAYAECICRRSKTQVAHFATFPTALVERCILAGTSQAGCCSACGAAWVRQITRQTGTVASYNGSTFTQGKTHAARAPLAAVGQGPRTSAVHTTGFAPACACAAGPAIPCTVLDPFVGSGTVPLVARALGRHAVGLDLSLSYLHLARERLSLTALDAWTHGSQAPATVVEDLPLFALCRQEGP